MRAEDVIATPAPTTNVDQGTRDAADATTADMPGASPISDELAQRIQRQIDGLCSCHPLLPLTYENNATQARQHTFQYFIALLESQDTLKLGICPHCDADRQAREAEAIRLENQGRLDRLASGVLDDPPPRVPELPKSLGFNLSGHMWRCETRRLEETHTRCCFCGIFILNDPDAHSHFEECYLQALFKMSLAMSERSTQGLPPLYAFLRIYERSLIFSV